MSISGSLEDVSVAEVMQFIHLGGRTGTLRLEAPDRRAEVGFHRGRIISAVGPGRQRLGDLLVERGEVRAEELAAALAAQERDHGRRSLGQILLSKGHVTPERLRQAVAEQIERTVFEIVGWSVGSFEFALDELSPVDDIALYPGDLLPDINLNTQMVVLEALRIFDEKNRSAAAADATPAATEAVPPSEAPAAGADRPPAAGAAPAPAPASPARIQLVTEDDELAAALARSLPVPPGPPARVEARDAGLGLPGEPPPVVILDLRHPAVDLERVLAIGRARGRAAIVTLLDPATAAAEAYRAGSVAALPPDPEAVAACLAALIRSRGEPAAGAGGPGLRSAFARLRRVVADLRSGLLSATVALNLMNVISESVERAIMFLVRGDELVALGAFGFAADGRPLADVTRGLHLPLARGNALGDAIAEGHAHSVAFDQANLPVPLAAALGAPRSGQVVVFPVLGSEEVISVIYTDNGAVGREIQEIDILELAAAQVGIAFENELLRRRMASRPG